VPAKVYEHVLSGPRSLVKAGHESPGHGVVVAESGSYVVIEADASMRREASCSSSSGRRRRWLRSRRSASIASSQSGDWTTNKETSPHMHGKQREDWFESSASYDPQGRNHDGSNGSN
jgi:hypothetical protein